VTDHSPGETNPPTTQPPGGANPPNTEPPGETNPVADLFGMTEDEFRSTDDGPAAPDPEDREAVTILAALAFVEEMRRRPVGAWAIMSRAPIRNAPPHPFDRYQWGQVTEQLDSGDSRVIRSLVRHPHPGVRVLAAGHPGIGDSFLAELTHDIWSEVRLAAVANPIITTELLDDLAGDTSTGVVEAVRIRRQSRPGEPDLLRRLDLCAVCGGRIKNHDFRTCSMRCSVNQRIRRCRNGFWLDATTGNWERKGTLRRAWPEDFRWRIASKVRRRGGIPGVGPSYRMVLVPFVRGVTSRRLARFGLRALEQGVDPAGAYDRLIHATGEFDGSAALRITARSLGMRSWA